MCSTTVLGEILRDVAKDLERRTLCPGASDALLLPNWVGVGHFS